MTTSKYVKAIHKDINGRYHTYYGHVKTIRDGAFQVEGNGANGYFIAWFREVYDFYTDEPLQAQPVADSESGTVRLHQFAGI